MRLPADEYTRRQKLLMTGSTLLLEDPLDIFYLTGMQLSMGMLLVCPKGCALYVDGRYIDAAKECCQCPVFLLEKDALKAYRNNTVIFDSAQTSYERFLTLKKTLKHLEPLASVLKAVRAIKSPYEIACMRKSASLLWKGYLHLKKSLKVGMKEREAALLFEMFCRQQGAEKMAFDPIIAFGENSAYPHHHPSTRKLQKNDLILIDIGICLDGYHSDMTRTLLPTRADPKLRKMYAIVREAQKAALSHCRPNVAIATLDRAARRVMKSAQMEELFTHSLGHGIGLQTHEFPRIKWDHPDGKVRLKKGMCITIEPGLYQSGLGGIRYEDTIVITERGYENLYPE